MFILSRLSDRIRINPRDFHLPRAEALTNQINAKYANKIVHNLGLVMRVFDIVDISTSLVLACQDGAYQCLVLLFSILFWLFTRRLRSEWLFFGRFQAKF